MIVVELEGLEVFGRHGVLDEERRDGQMFFYDVRLELGGAPPSDRVEDTIDYRDIADCVREVSDSRQFNLIEALAAAVADALTEHRPRSSDNCLAHLPFQALGEVASGCGYRVLGLTIETARLYLRPATLRTTFPLPAPSDAST